MRPRFIFCIQGTADGRGECVTDFKTSPFALPPLQTVLLKSHLTLFSSAQNWQMNIPFRKYFCTREIHSQEFTRQ